MDNIKLNHTLENIPKDSVRYVYWGVFRVRQPRFWHDPQRIIKLTFLMRVIIALCWLFITFMYILRLMDFELLMNWDFYSMDVNGVINLIQTKKI